MVKNKPTQASFSPPDLLLPSLRDLPESTRKIDPKRVPPFTSQKPSLSTKEDLLPTRKSLHVVPLTLDLAANRIVTGSSLITWKDEPDLSEIILKRFDLEILYGPSVGISRSKRYERAKKLGLKPPIEVYEAIKKSKKSNSILDK